MSEVETEKIDWAKVTQMQEALEEYAEEKLKRVLVFDPKDIVRKAKQIREIFDEDLGTIRYVLLNYADLTEIIEKYPDNRDRSLQFLVKQLAPANPGLTDQDVRAMPYEVVVRLLTRLQGEGSFFSRKQASTPGTLKNGSASTLKPKTSV
jgi:hypothetical protein